MEFDKAEVERSYREAWEATERVLRPTHPARFKVGTSFFTFHDLSLPRSCPHLWSSELRCGVRLQTATQPSNPRKMCFLDLIKYTCLPTAAWSTVKALLWAEKVLGGTGSGDQASLGADDGLHFWRSWATLPGGRDDEGVSWKVYVTLTHLHSS